MLEIIENKSSFTDSQLVRMVKRDNNPKRNYLLVNSIQGKHIPADPSDVLKLFRELALQVKKVYENQKIIFIGFAETATAVGVGVASCFEDSYYIHTTREVKENANVVVEFKEEHSHATEQLLYCNNWDEISSKADRIIFVEDEITTGKTILNFVNVLINNKKVRPDMKFSACSILNGMTDGRKKELSDCGLDFFWLVRLHAVPDSNCVYEYDQTDPCIINHEYKQIKTDGYINPRFGTDTSLYLKACDKLSQTIIDQIDADNKKIAVIGTEECMFPAIYTASEIMNKTTAKYVRTHSTTRSPIVAETSERYPLRSRYQVESLYESDRRTFIYNTDYEYDLVIIVTDTDKNDISISRLMSAFSECSEFVLVKWGEK